MAVRYDGAGRAPFRFSPSVLPAPPPTAKNLRCIRRPSSLLLTFSYLLSESTSGDPRAPLRYYRLPSSSLLPRPLPPPLPYRARRDRRY